MKRVSNKQIGTLITRAVGNMWTAYIFTIWSLLPLVIPRLTIIVQYVSQDIIQLVLLSVIMVGQSVDQEEAEARHAEQMARLDGIVSHIDKTVMAELAEIKVMHRELRSKIDGKTDLFI